MSGKIKTSGAFGVMSVLSYIGNGLWALLFMIFLIGCIINGKDMVNGGSFEALFGGMLGVFALMSALIVILCWLCISGVSKMKKGIRKGFIFYLIGNGLWSVLLIYGGRDGTVYMLGGALVSIIFIGFYAMKLPKMS
jgi:hypothetical protein